jgi:hypothetical protein
MSMKSETEAAVVSIHENTNERTARLNLRWEGKRQISDFALDKWAAFRIPKVKPSIAGGRLLNFP